jgi:hypothetical protein
LVTPKIIERTCILVVASIALILYSYHVRELLASLALFTAAFLVLALAALAFVLLWWASEQLASRSGPASRKVIEYSRRVIATYGKP